MFFKNISADFRRITDLVPGKPWIIRVIYPFTCPGFHAMIWFRLIHANRRWKIPIFYYIFALILRVINTFTQWFWGICIASNSDIGPGLYIAHHGQIFVGVKSMGENCTIGHNVTIGRTEKDHGYPRIGSNVYIAPGAVVIGNIEIGDNVKIGPNSVVRRTIASNSVVMAIPPRVIRMTSKEEWSQRKDSVEESSASKEKPSSGGETKQTATSNRNDRKDESRQSRDSNRRRRQNSGSRRQNHRSGGNRRQDGNPPKAQTSSRETTSGSEPKTQGSRRDNRQRSRNNRERNSNYNRNRRRSSGHPSEKSSQDYGRDVKKETTPDVTPKRDDAGEELELLNITERTTRSKTSWPVNGDKNKWTDDMEGESLDD